MGETRQLGRGLVTEIFGDTASDKAGYLRALREVLEWIKEEERDCGAFGSINADGPKTKIKRSINE